MVLVLNFSKQFVLAYNIYSNVEILLYIIIFARFVPDLFFYENFYEIIK